MDKHKEVVVVVSVIIIACFVFLYLKAPSVTGYAVFEQETNGMTYKSLFSSVTVLVTGLLLMIYLSMKGSKKFPFFS